MTRTSGRPLFTFCITFPCHLLFTRSLSIFKTASYGFHTTYEALWRRAGHNNASFTFPISVPNIPEIPTQASTHIPVSSTPERSHQPYIS